MVETMNKKYQEINDARRRLRKQMLERLKTNPIMEDSEVLRLLENDIEFWESQTDTSISGLMKTIKESFKNE